MGGASDAAGIELCREIERDMDWSWFDKFKLMEYKEQMAEMNQIRDKVGDIAFVPSIVLRERESHLSRLRSRLTELNMHCAELAQRAKLSTLRLSSPVPNVGVG